MSFLLRRYLTSEAAARQLTVGRTLVATTLLTAPVPVLRLFGLDTATAQRIAWLARMAAVRDGALGVGALAASRTGNPRSWLIGGAVSDAVDAAAVAVAMRQGRVRGVRPAFVVAGAAVAAAANGFAALGSRRG
jgi:hypothetical protein